MSEKTAPEEIETVTLSREQLLELRVHDQTLRALRAEQALIAERLVTAEREGQAFLQALNAQVLEDGSYEPAGGVDNQTGKMQRKLTQLGRERRAAAEAATKQAAS